MAMVVRRLGVICLVLFVSACDHFFYGPTITNAFGTGIEAVVSYSDGQVSRISWLACERVSMGKPNAEILKVSFEKDGKVLRQLGDSEIRGMLAKEDEWGYRAWTADANGMMLITSAKFDPCPR